ncbi:MAG: tetratricopeptide repeat protein [Gammaproteobacteria bacterium]
MRSALAQRVQALANAYASEDFRKAEALATRVLADDSAHPGALHIKGAALHRLGRTEAGLEYLRRAVADNPRYALALTDLGGSLNALGRFEEGRAALEEALAVFNENPTTHNLLGDGLRRSGAVRAALAPLRRAVQLAPRYADAHFNLALALLQLGELEEGFREYEWRWALGDFPTRPLECKQPRLHRQPLARKTVLLQAEQGFGDAIQFARYASYLAGRGAVVLVRCKRPLRRLLARVEGVAGTVGLRLPPFDYHCPLMSLPMVAGTTLSTIPGFAPYVAPYPTDVEKWNTRLQPLAGLKVGLVWTTEAVRPDRNPNRYDGANRDKAAKSLAPSHLAPLLAVPGISWISLQPAVLNRQMPSEMSAQIVDVSASLTDFAQTAAAITGLDLVITVDSAVAHLAGALNRGVDTVTGECGLALAARPIGQSVVLEHAARAPAAAGRSGAGRLGRRGGRDQREAGPASA